MAKPFMTFVDELGNDADQARAVFPICRFKDNEMVLLGTGFFISAAGIFVTAKHVLEEETGNIFAFTFMDSGYLMRPITQFTAHQTADVGVGTVLQAKDSKGALIRAKEIPLSEYEPEAHELISCLGYPHSDIRDDSDTQSTVANFNLNTVHGEVTQVEPNGYGIVKGHVFVIDMTNKGGSSGGPVFTPSAKGAVGIASSGMDAGYYYVVSAINQIRLLALKGIELPGKAPAKITVQKLIDQGMVKVV